ncbi:septation protein A [Legionella londiniensis]|uniref:Inner membrane-spanning protein YciB n=1 Tax=Legionella londiniensis TaxID=45068 RepID=A0A0W0VND5_9GAMM|nr:septation protein A [Legionella londiniensis]KTD21560.1 intracellular septation protein A [Legionella londiniensis]STX92763.1 intracellular septation protein [Legionella londiniensis]
MKLLFDFFPILLFFICYKLFDIYYATAVAMGASLLQVIFYRIKNQRYEKMHLISLGLIMVLGGATLFFHNPWFIKWKPTGLYWLAAIVFLSSSFIGKKTLIEKMMDGNIHLPAKIWRRLNYAWSAFFILMGCLNLYVAYSFDTDFWVNFKLFGGAGLTLIFVFLQAIYLARHVVQKDIQQETSANSIRKSQ